MLNKLLKRCMPWMDKGRWYKLVLTGTSDNYEVDKDFSDPIFYNAFSNFSSDNKIITIENPGAVFLECKCMIEFMTTLIGVTLDIYSFNQTLTLMCPINTVNLSPVSGTKLTLWMFGR